MVEFRNREEVERWLEGKPREVAVALAARAALRVLPLLVSAFEPRGADARGAGRDIILPTLRAVAVPWVYAACGAEVKAAAFAASTAVARAANQASTSASVTDAVRAAFGASTAVSHAARSASPTVSGVLRAIFRFSDDFSRDVTLHAASAASAASAAASAAAYLSASHMSRSSSASSAYADALAAVAADANAMDAGVAPADRAVRPLWLDDGPQWASKNWALLSRQLLSLGDDWRVWTMWYQARLDGDPVNKDLEVARVLIAETIWNDGPKVVNAEIRRLIEIYAQKSFELPNPNELLNLPDAGWREAARADTNGPSWDFFLSYSIADEPFARWIATLLDAVGIRVFAQFNDIPAGSNFVREMQRGLAQSSRFIALQSPDYVRSDHCQAEWSAAYANDPGGHARKLIQFLIRPTELSPLAGTIVYKSLVGLSLVDAANTVLESLGYHLGLAKIPSGWPGSSAIEGIQGASGGIYDVVPSARGLLERQQISFDPQGEAGFTPQQLFDHLAHEITEFANYTKRRKGNFSYSDRIKERAEGLNQTISHRLSECDALTLNKQLTWMLRVIEYDQKEGLIPDHDEIESYRGDLFGYYNKLEHIFPQLKTYRRMDARQRFTSPTPEVEQAIEAIYGGLGDPKVAAGVLSPNLSKELKEAGEDIAKARQLDESKSSEDTRDVTVESHTNAATRSLAVWNWLANAPDKFAKSGKKLEDVHKAIENYEKLYGKLSPQMQTYLGYLLKWFF